MEKVIDETDVQFQESMWIEIIRRMESIYAELANSQAEIERRSKELMEAKGFTDNIIRSMVDALMVLDPHGNIKMVNQATLDLLGYREEEIIGKPAELLFTEEEAEKGMFFRGSYLGKSIEEGSVRDLEVSCRKKSGEEVPMAFSSSVMRNSKGEMVGIVGVAKDLREIKKLLAEAAAAAGAERAKAAELEKAYKELQQLQAQLIQSEKLASMGQLAASVAHEINNPLSGVLTYVKLLIKKTSKQPFSTSDLKDFKRYLTTMEREISRCGRIVRNLLDFARPTEPRFKPVNINEIINESLSLVRNQITLQAIKIEKDLSPLPQTTADFAQLQQVFMNIILNASEAMKDGGTLSISTRWQEEERSVEIELKDTGCGIPQANLSKIFDPFFTTKEKGTGLGLSVAYGIINKHRGTVDVKSKLGEGSTFIIKLPLITLANEED